MTVQRMAQLLSELDGLVDGALRLRQRVARDLLGGSPTGEDLEAALDLAARVEDDARSVASLLREVPLTIPKRAAVPRVAWW